MKNINKETVEQAAENKYIPGVYIINGIDICEASKECFIDGAKWQAKRMYSEEEVKLILDKILIEFSDIRLADVPNWFNKFKKK